jgi:hypothetical protein
LSPKPRRTRPGQSGRRKSQSRPVGGSRKPVYDLDMRGERVAREAVADEVESEELEGAEEADAEEPEPMAAEADSSGRAVAAAKSPGRVRSRAAVPASPTVRRRRGIARVRRSRTLGSLGEWAKAYLPLLAVFVVIFAAVWAYTSYGPHTPTPADKWHSIADNWKGKRDSAHDLVNSTSGDFSAQIAALKDLEAADTGWANELTAVQGWNDSAHSQTANQDTAADMLSFIQALQNQATVIDQIVTANTNEALQSNSTDLMTTDGTIWHDYQLMEYDILGATSSYTPLPSLQVPSAPPSPSEGPSASATASAEPSPPPSAEASATPTAGPSPSAG